MNNEIDIRFGGLTRYIKDDLRELIMILKIIIESLDDNSILLIFMFKLKMI